MPDKKKDKEFSDQFDAITNPLHKTGKIDMETIRNIDLSRSADHADLYNLIVTVLTVQLDTSTRQTEITEALQGIDARLKTLETFKEHVFQAGR